MDTGPVTKTWGTETRTYYTGNPLNRLSFLREDYKFLSHAFTHPSTRFLPLNKLDPLINSVEGESPRLAYLSFDEIKQLTGGDPFELSEEDQIKQWDSSKHVVGVNKALTVFLGVDETDKQLKYKEYSGRAYFAVDVTSRGDEALASSAEAVRSKAVAADAADNKNLEFQNVRFGVKLTNEDAALYAHARMYVDWNTRNRFCGGCGSRVMSVNGGCKLICPSVDNGVDKPACDTRGTVSNLSFPRTDCVVIMAIVDYEGKRLLLGRNKRYPGVMYSCLAGFLEPAESLEECVRREVWEEAGVTVGNVHVYASQPWPYPANIMVGCIGEAKPGTEAHEINLGHDPELVDAQWVPFDKVRSALKGEIRDEMFLPPRQAIANVLINAVVNEGVLSKKNNKL